MGSLLLGLREQSSGITEGQSQGNGDGCIMSKEYEHRRHAAATVELAQRANSDADRARLLAMADAWLDLAARSQVQRIKELEVPAAADAQ